MEGGGAVDEAHDRSGGGRRRSWLVRPGGGGVGKQG
jgi:hypothetical protein